MYKTHQIKTGCYGVIFKSDTVIGKIIAKFTDGYSHTINFVWGRYDNIFGLYVFEMTGDGCIRTLYEKSKYYKATNWTLFEPIKPFTNFQALCFKVACEYAFDNFNYDIDCLLRHAYMKFFGHFPKEKIQDNKIVCSQLTGIATNAAVPYLFIDPECLSPLHCWKSKNHKKVKPLKIGF